MCHRNLSGGVVSNCRVLDVIRSVTNYSSGNAVAKFLFAKTAVPTIHIIFEAAVHINTERSITT